MPTHPGSRTIDFFSRRYIRMYQNAPLLAAFPLIHYSFIGRVGRSWIGGPIVGIGVGVIAGQDGGLDMIRVNRASIMRVRGVYRVRSR